MPEPSADAGVFAVISGGGTAGHVNPAIAIADALVTGGRSADSIHFVGSERGVEARLVPEAGYEQTLLPGRGIARRLTFANVGAVIGLLKAVLLAGGLLRRLRPNVVVAMGGYASVPCALWAWLLRIPIVVAEQNAAPGLANRISARFAKVSAVSFVGTPLPRAVVTGNPTATGRLMLSEQDARQRRDLGDDQRLVSVFGGSLGAGHINRVALDAADRLLEDGDLVVDHVIGRRDWVAMADDVAAADTAMKRYRPYEYEDDMASLLNASELVVCRSGASTVAELTLTATPSVLVPLPGAPADHQTANARSLVDSGAALLIADADLSETLLVDTVRDLLATPTRLHSMREGAASLARPDAATAVANLCTEYARR